MHLLSADPAGRRAPITHRILRFVLPTRCRSRCGTEVGSNASFFEFIHAARLPSSGSYLRCSPERPPLRSSRPVCRLDGCRSTIVRPLFLGTGVGMAHPNEDLIRKGF